VLLEIIETKIDAKDYNVIEAEYGGYGVMVFNATFNSISVKYRGGNRSTRRKPPTCRKLKSLTSFIT